MKHNILQFLKHVRIGYLLFSSLLILGLVYGISEIIILVFMTNTSQMALQILYFSRGIIVALLLMVWAAWTVYNYRELYQEKLDITEAKYRDIIEHSADAIISLNKDNEITSWNRGAEMIFGWKRDEMMGESVTKMIPDELLRGGELGAIQTQMNGSGYVSNYETERYDKSGHKIWVSLTESFIRDEQGLATSRSQILRDLTDLKIREEQIQHSERLATIGHMAAGVAHEVGNPLAAISSIVQLSERKTDDPFIRQQLGKVRKHIQRISKIVRDLVDFSRPSSRESQTMQVNEIVEAAVGLLRNDSRCREVDFNLSLGAEVPTLRGVPDQMHQVIVNILLNAVDAMAGVEKPKITIKTWRDQNLVKLSITDVGTGIPEEAQNHIFEPFYTTKEVGKGTGLGLSVSHGIITKMGGHIRVFSSEGKGTTFTIILSVNNKNHDRIHTDS